MIAILPDIDAEFLSCIQCGLSGQNRKYVILRICTQDKSMVKIGKFWQSASST